MSTIHHGYTLLLTFVVGVTNAQPYEMPQAFNTELSYTIGDGSGWGGIADSADITVVGCTDPSLAAEYSYHSKNIGDWILSEKMENTHINCTSWLPGTKVKLLHAVVKSKIFFDIDMALVQVITFETQPRNNRQRLSIRIVGEAQCQSSNILSPVFGGSISAHQTANELDALLKRKTGNQRRSITTG